jgi:hypothetical protein
MPEGIAFAANMCYVASLEHNSIVAISPTSGSCQQVSTTQKNISPDAAHFITALKQPDAEPV